MVKATRDHPLLLSLFGALTVAVGILMLAPQAQAQQPVQDCRPGIDDMHCIEKAASPDPVTVGETVTFTVREFVTPVPPGFIFFSSAALVDELPPGIRVVSVSVESRFARDCSVSGNTVTCPPPRVLPFTLTIEAIPTECGSFTNIASAGAFNNSTIRVEAPFTVVGCEEEEVPAPAPITQEGEQESESGEIDQTFEVS